MVVLADQQRATFPKQCHSGERAFAEHDAYLLNLLQFPAFRPLYPDPRFVDLVRRLHLDPATASKEEDGL